MRYHAKYILAFIGVLYLTACTSIYPPTSKAGLLVTSPPHQTFLICDAEDMTPEMVELCMRMTQDVDFKDYNFAENFNIGVSAEGIRQDTRDYSESTSITTSKEEK